MNQSKAVMYCESDLIYKHRLCLPLQPIKSSLANQLSTMNQSKAALYVCKSNFESHSVTWWCGRHQKLDDGEMLATPKIHGCEMGSLLALLTNDDLRLSSYNIKHHINNLVSEGRGTDDDELLAILMTHESRL